ncbi:hypothetical protein L228DRAFT_247284 [Xylona heveae TC161]|uniref:Large ribosomal subunit protein mL50 n=1 Tax=Xylona heveae (strain CBS 132557 / TC161) TaxID=1328760 RepID=A0A161TB69_XYLHT|nr:hypothetical protein L228DRAFT_247284 [Xylona heveae TC161]KZF22877.1 hypothetical protein L228DRAFT_247284 [Xylona heveae TC161]
MRRLSRLQRSIDPLTDLPKRPSATESLCFSCRTRNQTARTASPFTTSTSHPARRSETGEVPLTERLRRKIWGTETPPGQDDPYSRLSENQQLAAQRRPRESSANQNTTGYEPATTWDGLESVGGFGHWWKENWDPAHKFQGFMPSERLDSRAALASALYRAVVEIFTLQGAGRPVSDVCNIRDDGVIGEYWRVQLDPSADGQTVAISYPNEHIRDDILKATIPSKPVEEVVEAEQEAESSHSTIPAASEQTSILEERVAAWGTQWFSIPLHDRSIKFTIIKRVMQLTGVRIPDPTIQHVNTLGALLNNLAAAPKPRKLADALFAHEEMASLPNVKLSEHRVTPIDKERDLGRWKLIERELRARGLPVTGHTSL